MHPGWVADPVRAGHVSPRYSANLRRSASTHPIVPSSNSAQGQSVSVLEIHVKVDVSIEVKLWRFNRGL